MCQLCFPLNQHTTKVTCNQDIHNTINYLHFYRVESIGILESKGKSGDVQRKQIILVDNDGVKLRFLLWGEQILLANLFR